MPRRKTRLDNVQIDSLEQLLALQQGGIREALRILYAGNGGMRANAILELARLVPSDVLALLERTGKPCP